MDFPANLKTNTFEIAGISQISWKFYLSDQSATAEADDLYRIHLLSESQLREQGHHVYADCANRGIWAFCLSLNDQENLSRAIAFLNLEEKLGGSLHVNDLRRLSPSDSDLKLETTYFGDAGSANLHSFQHNVNQASTDIQIDNSILENENVDLGTIYFYFNLTIRRSLTFALAGKSDWLYCDNDSCINEETLNFGDLTNPNTTEVTSFRCRWALSGAIKVSIITKIVPKLHRLSDLLSEGNEGTLLGLVAVSLPIHCNGWIRGVLPFWRRKHHTNDLTHLKASIRDTLSSIGMSIPFNENWIILELIEGLSNRPKPRRYILWPANLCFVATPKQVIQALKGHTAQHLAIMDPIARAEAWFHGRHEREHVAKHEQNQNSKMDQHSQFEDALSPINHRSLLQDASTVYPTPPDGANSQNNDTPMKDEDDGLSHHSTADVYGRKTDEYQDMFGDHEMDLTEADFEFFDDPGEADPKPATSATVSATPDDTSSPQNEAPMMDAPSDLENDNQRMETRRDPENTYEAPPSPAILATRNETVATGVPLNHVTQETQQASPAESIATSNVVEDFEDAPVMMSPSMTPDPNIVTTLHHGGTKLDEKYSVHGQFGFSTQSKVGGGSRKDLTQPLKKTIPRIGIAEGSASDSDDESDDQGTWERSSRGNSSSDEGLHDGDSTWNERSDQPVNHNPTDSDPIHIHAPPMLWLSTHSQGVSGALQCPHEEAKPQEYSDDPSQFMQMTQLITDHAISQTLVESDEIHEGPLSCIESGPTEPILEWIAANILIILGPDGDPILESLHDVSTDHYESDALYSQKYQLLRLSEPEFCVQRMETKLDMLPAALRLWEDLGLEPRCGGKDVKAIGMPFCRQDHLNEPIAKFVSQMRDTYIACNLGLHDNLGGDSPLEDASFEGDLQAMGTTLSEIAASRSSVVIYVVCYDLSPDTLREVSEGTGQLIQGYKASLPKNESESEIVVQIVPEYLVFNPSYVVTPDFNDLKKLAFEVYDRCAPLEAASQASYRVAPSISLARPIPSQIEFLSTPDAASAKLFHDTRIHLAYAWSVEQGWLTTSWTDNTGDLSWHASYVIGNEEEVWLEFAKAAMELFETTLTMLHPPSRPARVFICRDGTYLKEELEVWKSVISSKSLPHTFTFVTVNSNTSLQLASPPVKEIISEVVDQTLTPVSTPNAAGNSPDIVTTPAASAFESEADMRLIDVRDESWMFIPKEPIDDDRYMPSMSMPCLYEGYVLKRKGVVDEDSVRALSVHLIYTSEESSIDLLIEVLHMFHKLAFLARLRNITDSINGMLPIHVAAANKGCQAVSSAVRWVASEHG